jgi:hypothetical protein
MSDSYANGKPLPPRHHWVPRVFRRAEGFYIIDLPADDDLAEHARLNPGTIRIETVSGEQLWPAPPRIAA